MRRSLILYRMATGRARYRILVVDNDELVSDMVGQMVRRMGYLAVVCRRPMDALTLFSRVPERFDAVIVDEMMPDLRGTQLATHLLRIKDDIPIILMTGHGNMISLKEIRESGVRATLIKPVEKEWLQKALAELLRKRKRGL
jgi:DNA-binding NtrC family response regulator